MVNPKYRVDFELVNATQSELAKVQAKINQWITKGELVSYKHTVVGQQMLFEFCRVKGKEE